MKVKSCLYCGNEKLSQVTHRLDEVGIIKCVRCGVMMVDEISDDTEKLYTSDYFEKGEDTRSGYTNYLSSPVANLIGKYAFSRLFTPKIGRHLDLGCADGSLMEIFKSEGFATSGLEISKDAVKIASSKGLDVSFSRLHSFPKNKESSDVITAFDLLEHADKPGVVLREVYKNLKNGGHFVFSTLSVKKNDPTDYWFNNSLEHYVYYNKESLEFILTEVFGKDNFDFVEMDINGIAEFWGFGRKGEKDSGEKQLMDYIKKSAYDKKDATNGYLLSLFYNQVSQFDLSKQIVDHFKERWTEEQQIQAKFFNYFYQGKLEVAVNESKANNYLLPATNSIYWQALTHAETTLYEIRQKEYANAILELREQLFRTKDELHTLRNSRVLGRILKARDRIGNPSSLPGRVVKKVGKALVPTPIRRPLVGSAIKIRDSARKNMHVRRRIVVSVVAQDNTSWGDNKPLVSVVIPYYNRADTISETLESLRAQTFRNFEVLVVNDGSTDSASMDKLKEIEHSEFGAKIIHQKNQGVAAARNTGVRQAKGKYIICLDSDDMLEETYIEKAVTMLETNPDISLVSTHQDMFGVINEVHQKNPYNPITLMDDNTVITAAMFRKEAWESTEGYKSGIGYEDWEFWLNLAENGHWGKLLPEPLFKYRTALQSRYVDDKDAHWRNIKAIKAMHEGYKKRLKSLVSQRSSVRRVTTPDTAFVNLNNTKEYILDGENPRVLIAIPWMTFGGAETLIYNFCRQTKNTYDISFVTGEKSNNEWEYKFKEISKNVYHLPNLFDDKALYLEFISNYIRTRNVDILHAIHTNFILEMLPELKKRHPKLKVVVTMFNDRVPHYVEGVVNYHKHIDVLSSDNQKTAASFKAKLNNKIPVLVIPNGIDSENEFSPSLFGRDEERQNLGLSEDDLAVFFVGRLSEEKNPDVFVKAAKQVLAKHKVGKIKFFLIGDGPMRRDVEKLINGSENITYLGYQSEVARYLSAADVFVLPSEIEGFPLSILEAMAMKVVVIASRVGAIPDVIEHSKNGYIVEPGSVNDISKTIIDLDTNKAALSRVKRAGRKDVETKYSHKQLGQNYKKLYGSVLK